jgi:hypothetical protein
MALPGPRHVALLGSLALLVAALALAGRASSTAERAPAPTQLWSLSHRSIDATPGTALRSRRLARAPISWRGGPVTASTGETVDVRVSEALPVETATPEAWAEFFVSLAHGPELSRLTAYIATFEEVQSICGSSALGCYSADELIAPGEALIDGTTPEEVLRHEYGHHVAFNRVNPPWVAVDWGPKQWASAADVCARVTRREAYPGDEGSNYALNPGEAWAETYRLMDERRAGITTATWPIIAPSFYPGEAALQAAELDVLEPWSGTHTTVFARTFERKTKVWWVPLKTPLDGEYRISVTLPKGAEHDVALVGADRRRVLKRAQWVSQRVKRMSGTICGQRALFVRVTKVGAPGLVRVSVATP